MCNLRDKTIKAMSYENRLKRYAQEKQEVIEQNPGISGADLDEKLFQLRRKSGVMSAIFFRFFLLISFLPLFHCE